MQITELAAKLQSVGLTPKQARVYVAALFLGASAVQKIAQQAEINRATTYVILDELAKMGLVSESTEGKKTVFVAEPPEAIERYLTTQQKEITTRRDELKDLMPSLRQTSRSTDAEDAPVVRFYKGLEGSGQLSKDLLRKSKPGDVMHGFYNMDAVKEQFPDAVKMSENPNTNNRVKKKIKSKLLYYSSGEAVLSSRKLLRDTRRTDKKSQAEINIYPSTVSIITYRGDQSVGVVIESKDIAESIRQLFELAYESKNVKKT